MFISDKDTITDDDIDTLLSKGEERTRELNQSIEKALPSDEQSSLDSVLMYRLLDFKLDHSSIRLFDGVDYSEVKKKRDQELKDLMLSEISTNTTRRVKRVVHTEEKEGESTPTPKRALNLPSIKPYQVPSIHSIHSIVVSTEANSGIGCNCTEEFRRSRV